MRFDSMGFAEYGPWESSSGSEHSAQESSLSDMVNSFLEHDFYEDGIVFEVDQLDDEELHPGDAEKHDEIKTELRRLFGVEDSVKGSLLVEVEKAMKALDDFRSIGCRQLMSRLRARGLDAGLCKSKWQKQGYVPAGDHEYIDIINSSSNNTRYIVELSLVDQFTIARPTSHYTSLLETVPKVYIGTVEEMKQVVKLMCKAMKVSMGCRDMKVPPWRKYEYMKAKWFECYKRSTKSISSKNAVENAFKQVHSNSSHGSRERSVGFEVVVPNGYVLRSCRNEVSTRTGMEHGLLAAAFRTQQTEL